MRFAALGTAALGCALATILALTDGGAGWIGLAVILGAVATVGIYDLTQRRHSILRNYPETLESRAS